MNDLDKQIKDLEKQKKALDKLEEKKAKALLKSAQSPKVPKPKKQVYVDENSIPKWYEPIQRRELKDSLIKKHVETYAKHITVAGQSHQPEEKDIEEYRKLLNKQNIKDLMLVGKSRKYELKLDIGDRLKSIDKKKFAVVTIFNDNKTTDTGVCHCYSRTFSRSGMSYIVMGERGIFDPEFKMAHFYYYANNPFPIIFQKNKDPDAVADSRLLDDTIEMKVIEALANIDMDKKITFILFLVAIGTLAQIVDLIITLKSSGAI